MLSGYLVRKMTHQKYLFPMTVPAHLYFRPPPDLYPKFASHGNCPGFAVSPPTILLPLTALTDPQSLLGASWLRPRCPAYPVGSGRRFRACTGQQTRACLRPFRPFAAPQRNEDLIKLGTRVPFTGFFSPAISSMKGEQEVSWTHMAWSPFCSWQ